MVTVLLPDLHESALIGRQRSCSSLVGSDWSVAQQQLRPVETDRAAGRTGLKWRCLKEQRRKFAIIMTVNIRDMHFCFA